MQHTITKYFCDQCNTEMTQTAYQLGPKVDIRVYLTNPDGGAGQVAGVSMKLCEDCSNHLGITNKEEYHTTIYAQSRLRNAVEKIKTNVLPMLYRKEQ